MIAVEVPPMNGGVVGSTEVATFATTTPLAPASWMFCAFCTNEQRPRCTSTILPLTLFVSGSQASDGSVP